MGLRRRPRIVDDRFGSANLGTYTDRPDANAVPAETTGYQHVPNLTVPQAIEVITILLMDYQCKCKIVETADTTSWRAWFPFAWHTIKELDTIKNLSTGETYVVTNIIGDSQEYQKNYVVLSGKTKPDHWNILRFDNRRNDLVTILPAFPDTEAKPYTFTADGYVQKPEGDVWVDIITYTVAAEAPGSLSGEMFGPPPHERIPRFREDDKGTRYLGQWIDTRVRFDFWTQTNAGSERLREWFRDFTHKYRWLVEKNGVGRFLWQSSGMVSTASRWKDYIMHRSAFYDFRTEYSIYIDLFKIR